MKIQPEYGRNPNLTVTLLNLSRNMKCTNGNFSQILNGILS